MKKETKTAPQTAVPEKPAAPERVHGLDLISKYRGAIMVTRPLSSRQRKKQKYSML